MPAIANSDIQVQTGSCAWTPPSTVKDHVGGQLTSNCDFFVAPPREIGTVLTAHTSLKREVESPSQEKRVTRTIMVAGVIVCAGVGLTYVTHNDWLIPTGIVAAIAALITWFALGFKHICNFVGTEGCAEFQCVGAREDLKVKRLFCFKDAWAVSTAMTRHYTNGIYTRTSFGFYWYPPQGGKSIYAIAGKHTSNLKTPPLKNSYNFACSVESAWIKYLLPKINTDLQQKGYVNFFMGDGRWARLGPGFLDIVDKQGNVSRCEAGDIGSAKIASGVFTLTRKDAKSKFFGLLGSSGTFRFNYAGMYNARLFLLAFQDLLNIRVQ